MPTTTRRVRATKAAQQITTGAVSTASSVKGVVSPSPDTSCPAAPRKHPAVGNVSAHQTHGAVTPLTGPITSVSQLVNGGKNVAKGSAGSFETMAEYTAYLRALSIHDLRQHARQDVRIVPIDDRERLIRRLETEWTATASRHPGRSSEAIPTRKPFTRAQIEAQDAVKRSLLKQ